MGRKPCCVKDRVNRGAWSLQEDQTLSNYIQLHGEGKWRTLPQKAGLNRCGKSCRLRWMNYLRPGIKRGNISPDEEDLIIRLHRLLGNRWSLIAGRLPGRTDNEIKNYWNSVLSKRLNGVESTNPSDHKQCESVKSYRPSKVIAPKATRCTKTLIQISKQFNDHFTNSNCVAPSSTQADNIDEQLVLESRKNNNLQMPNNLEDEPLVDNFNALNYSEFSQSPLDDIFENCKTLETDLAPMSEMELDKLNSLLGFEDEWRYLLFQDDQ